MRKIIAISFLFVFTVLQYGKIMSWAYCELRVRITDQKTMHCDCEKIITDNQGEKQPPAPSHSHFLKDKLNELYVFTTKEELSSPIILDTSCFILHSDDLQKGCLNIPHHPPALIS